MVDLTLEGIFTGGKKLLALISLILIGAGLFADFITNVVWFSRIDPWFMHGLGSCHGTYQSTAVCWFFSLVGLILIALLIIFYFFMKPLFEKITGRAGYTVITIATISCVVIISIISAIVASSYGLKETYSIEDSYYGDEVAVNMKCYAYMDIENSLDAMVSWALARNKLKSFDKWGQKFMEKAIIEKRECIDDGEYEQCIYTTKYTNYLCAEVGAPSLVFAIVQIFGLILFYYTLILNIVGAGSNDSINENDENISNQPREIEEQQQPQEQQQQQQQQEQEEENREKVDESNEKIDETDSD